MTNQTLARRETPVPAFYDAAHAREWSYRANEPALFGAAHDHAAAYGIKAAGSAGTRIHLLLIDLQKDFCFPEGALYVGGRSGRGDMEDNDRIARFIYRKVEVLNDITVTLDSP